jgi:hypothetical protein
VDPGAPDKVVFVCLPKAWEGCRRQFKRAMAFSPEDDRLAAAYTTCLEYRGTPVTVEKHAEIKGYVIDRSRAYEGIPVYTPPRRVSPPRETPGECTSLERCLPHIDALADELKKQGIRGGRRRITALVRRWIAAGNVN